MAESFLSEVLYVRRGTVRLDTACLHSLSAKLVGNKLWSLSNESLHRAQASFLSSYIFIPTGYLSAAKGAVSVPSKTFNQVPRVYSHQMKTTRSRFHNLLFALALELTGLSECESRRLNLEPHIRNEQEHRCSDEKWDSRLAVPTTDAGGSVDPYRHGQASD